MSVPVETTEGQTFPELVQVMKRLLAPDGCPWDREQTMDSLKPYLIEEAYEVLEAMDGPADEHAEELGDLLMQVVFQAELGEFTVDDAIRSIVEKLVRRHPHVFADSDAADSEAVLAQWEAIKAQERAAKGKTEEPASVLDGVPAAMPALTRAQQLTRRASRVGFDWPDAAGPRAKVLEELDELDQAIAGGDPDEMAAEMGDLLFAVVNLARKHKINPEMALRDSTGRFVRHFKHVEQALRQDGKTPGEATLDEMNALWEEAKAKEA